MPQQCQKVILLKFGKKCYMEEFRMGILYMNELAYFKTLEEKCGPRSDKDEGLTAVYQAKGGQVLHQNNTGQYAYIGTITDQLQYRESYSLNQNIFCMSALQVQPIKQGVDKRNFKFGDTFIFISDPGKLIGRIKFAAEKEGIKVFHKFVEYVNRKKHNGSLGPFRKFSEFSYQNEFRILVCLESPGPYKFCIGDISDITAQGDLSFENLNSLLHRF